MNKSVAILGRQPALGLAELESLYGAEKLKPISDSAAVLDTPPADVVFSRLGGTVKLAKLLTIIDTTDWKKLEDYLVKHLPDHVCCIPEGKLTLGLSAYNLNVSVNTINKTTLALKKVVRETGRPCRIVPNKEPALSSAQVLHNKLFTSHNWELILIGSGNQTYLAQTTNVQDINAYAARDQARPKRDARVGMLPPKLAQIIINLARPDSSQAILDPFCGTGVVLQEALLMGFDAYGTDLEERMIDYSKVNLDWLAEKAHINDRTYLLETGDATNFEWQGFDTIASETYLGRPFSAEPKPEILREVMQDVDTIHKKFLKNVARQTQSGFRLCLAVPAWIRPTHRPSLPGSIATSSARASGTRDSFSAPMLNRSSTSTASSASHRENDSGTQMRAAEFIHLPVLDHLTEMGYTRQSFVHAQGDDLIYHREGQIVGRELVVLIRK